jgi:predicted TIM-barrel fold metal-dependent hydrolase
MFLTSIYSSLLWIILPTTRTSIDQINSADAMTTLGVDPSIPLPAEFIDAHHHFMDTSNDFSKEFLGSLMPSSFSYLPDQYQKDVVEPLMDKAGVKVVGSVHVEAMPADGLQDAEWVTSLANSKVVAIVASCDLASPDVSSKLQELHNKCPKVKGIRWILDCVGPFEPNTATHVATLRHDGIDYLRGSNGGYCGQTVPAFEQGFALLADHSFSFDLQCAPVQLPEAAKLCARHPNVPVVIDHMGKPRILIKADDELEPDGGNSNSNTSHNVNQEELEAWRIGMKAMAAIPHAHVKLSMLGYAVPGWQRTSARMQFLKDLIEETVDLFGTDRCMVALNWWKDGATADSDGVSDMGPDPVQFVTLMSGYFLAKYSDIDRTKMFARNARQFYKI